MATIPVNLNVTSNGTTDNETKKAKELNAQLALAAANASKIGSGGGSQTKSKISSASDSVLNRSLGSGAGTGSDTSDFAAQARGLGGLVHVYATFAANIYAVSTAFTALSHAANVSHIIQGLDQLGAATGKNLGSLAARLVAVSDGTLSMKDALEATAKAASSGLSSDQFLKLAEVAKKAAQALGREMPDAMDRITRGAIKMEPRLLDELGILVKVGEANTNYARTLGKTSSSLSDVEKHQGFANAVIEQGLAKFKDINVAANPYQKITASLSNLTQTGLAFINTVLSPLVNLLASNPTALLGALAYGAVALTKQALPALAEYRKGLEKAVEKAATLAEENRKVYANYHEGELNALKAVNDKKIALIEDNLKQTQLKSQQYADKSVPFKGGVFKGVTTIDSADLSQKHLDILDKTIAKTTIIAGLDNAQGNTAKDNLAAQLKTRELTVARMQMHLALTHAQTIADTENLAVLNKKAKFWSEDWQLQQNAKSALSKFNSATIVKDAAENYSKVGLSEAFKHLNGDIKDAGTNLTLFGKISAFTGGSLSILTGAIGTAFNAFQPWILLITVLAPIFGALYDAMRSNSKEMEEVAKASIEAQSAFDNVGRTIDTLNKKPILERLTPETLHARATAISEVASALGNVTSTLDKALGNASNFDNFVDSFKSLWGGDLKTIATKGMSQLLSASISAGFAGDTKDKFKKSLSEILNTTDLSNEGINKAVSAIPLEDTIAKFNKLTEVQKAYSVETNKSAQSSSQFELSLDATSKAASAALVSLTPSDNMAKYGISLMQSSTDLAKVLQEGPVASLAEMNKLLSDSSRLSILPADAVSQLLGVKTRVDEINKAISNASDAITVYETAIAKNKSIIAKNPEIASKEGLRNSGASKAAIEANKVLEENLKEQEIVRDVAISKVDSLMSKFALANEAIFDAGAKHFGAAISASGAQAAINIAKAGTFTGTGAANEQYNLKVQEIELAKEKLVSESNLLKAQISNTAAIDALSASLALDKASSDLKAAQDVKKSADDNVGPNKAKLVREANSGLASAEKAVDRAQEAKTISDYTSKHVEDSAKLLEINIADLKNARDHAKTDSERRVINSELAVSYKNYVSLASIDARLVTENSKIEAAAIERKVALLKEQLAIDQKLITNAQDLQASKAKDLEIANKYGEIGTVQYINDKASADLANQSLIFKTKEATNNERIAELQLKKNLGHKDELALAEAIAEKSRLESMSSIERAQIDLERNHNLEDYYATQKLSLATAQVNGLVGTGNLSTEAGALEVLKLQVAEQERLNQKKRDAIDKTFTIDIAKAADGDGTTALDAKKAATTELDKQIAQQNALSEIEKSRLTHAKEMADHAKEYSFEMDKLNKTMSKTESLANSLTKVFKNFGSGLGSIVKASAKNSIDQKNIDEKLFQDKLKLQEKYGAKSIEYLRESEALEATAKEDKLQNEVSMYAGMSDAAASMFKDKTGAAQAFHAISTGIHVVEMGMQLQAIALDQSSLAGIVARSAIKTAVKVAEGAATMFAEGGWFAFAGIAAMLAVMASLGSKGGGSAPTFTQTSEEKQKVQGTGQKFNSSTGKLDDTGSGVLGDSSAKSDSIKNSLAIVAKFTFDELDYSNQMVVSLRSIDRNMGALAAQLAKTLGIQTGSGFGTIEGKTHGLGETSSIFSNKLFGGGAAQAFAESVQRIFGGATTTKILGSGINIAGTVGQLASGAGTRNQYETVNTTKSGGWFHKDTNTTVDKTVALNEQAQNSITQMFKSVRDNLTSVGAELGVDAKIFNESLNNFSVKIPIETRDLKGQALTDAINNTISAAIDGIVLSTLSMIAPFAKVGEALFETATRVANDSKVIGLQLKSVGISFKGVGIEAINSKENMIALAGGLDIFISQSEYFKQNFLTDAQKLAPVQEALSKEMTRLNISSIKTKEAFTDLVLSQDLSTESGRQTYQALMNISRAFITVYGSAADTSKLISDRADMEFDILKKLSTAQRALVLDRRKELAALDVTLRPLKEYIYALEDEAIAKANLAQAYQTQSAEIQNTIDKLDGSSKSLKDFNASLLLSAQSTLTPQQKYAESQKQFDQILSLASAPAATKEEIAAKDTALSQLQGAATAFLAASAIYNASSPQYTSDFNKVTTSIGATALALSKQKTDAEKQLEELKSSVQGLVDINTSVLSVKDAITALTSAINASQVLGANSGSSNFSAGSTAGGSNGTSRTSAITGLYQGVLGRTPDIGGLQYWEQSTTSLNQIRKSFYLSNEFIHGLSSVEDAYTKILHRAPDAAGLEFYKQSLLAGQTMGSVVDSMLKSTEYANMYPGLSKGGIGKGTTWVGENGPELVNFDSPGRVFSNSQSQGMMESFVQPLLAELKSLRDTVEQLKEANRQDAGNIIASNYDANQRNADIVSVAVTDASSKNNWANKQQVQPV